MERLQDVIITTKVAIELADDALAQAKQTKQSLKAKLTAIRERSEAVLDKYQLL